MNAITEYTLNKVDLENVKEYKIEKSKDNKNIIKIFKNKKNIYLGSKYSVNRDIDKLYKKLENMNDETIIIIFGLGAGEHIKKILNDTKYNKIIVIEPDEFVIKTFLNLDTSKEILENNRFILSVCEKNELKYILNSLVTEIDVNNVKFIDYVNYNVIYKDEYENSLKLYMEIIEKCVFNINTGIVFRKKIMEGYLNNIKNIIQSNPVNLYKNIYKDMRIPAIVVSAGPSLSKNIDKLKKAKDKFIIICGARTLKPLLNTGVVPDFVCIIDPVDANLQFVKDIKDYNAKMLFCEVANFKTVNAYKGNKIIFKEESTFKNLTDNILEYKLDSLWQGGSVAHACTSFASYIGCDEIIFIGQDFAYTNNKYHDDKADFDRKNNDKIEENNFVIVEDIYGEKVSTSKTLDFYRINLQDYIAVKNKVKFINATEGGANIIGTQIMTLEEVISLHNNKIDKGILNQKQQSECFDREKIINNLKLMIKDLNKLQNKTKVLLDKIRKINKNNIVINNKSIKLLKKIKSNNNNIDKKDILNALINPIIEQIVLNSKYRPNSNNTELENIEKILNQSEVIYNLTIQSCEEIKPMIDNLIDELLKGVEKSE